MSTLSLTRRKTQLALLSTACERRQRARFAAPDASERAAPRNTRFLALEADHLLLDWPIGGADELGTSGATVEISFEDDGEQYTFRAQSHGRVWWTNGLHGPAAAWRLSLPLHLQHQQRRASGRVSLADLAPLPVRFTSTADPQAAFVGRLLNLSPGGLGAVVAADEDPDVGVGDLHWAEFELPAGGEPFEFVVRCVHANTLEPGGTTVLGCAFCPTDDAVAHRAQLDRLEQFVVGRQVARRQRGRTPRQGGT